jgi:glycosyltransferase involved in cell wall biosynthesis
MSKRKIRCIFVCNEMLPSPHGGIGNYTLNIANALVNLGVDTTVIGLYNEYENENFNKSFRLIRVKPLNVKVKKLGLPGFIHRFQLHQKIKSITRDPGHWVVEWPDFQGMWLRKNPNAIEIHKIHGPSFLQPNPGIPSWDAWCEGRQILKLGNWSTVSKYYGDWICQKLNYQKEYFVSYIPIDTNVFKPNLNILEEDLQITFCGNKNTRKHPESLVKAFVRLSDKYPKLKLNFAGNIYSEEQKIRKSLPSFLQNQVTFLGLLSPHNVAQLLNSTTVFCLPSEHESFGMAWVEAMACGVPVVAGRGSCAEEIVTPDAGIMVDPNSSEEVAQAIDQLLSNPTLRQTMGQVGREIVCQKYDAQIIGKRILEWYSILWNEKIKEHV